LALHVLGFGGVSRGLMTSSSSSTTATGTCRRPLPHPAAMSNRSRECRIVPSLTMISRWGVAGRCPTCLGGGGTVDRAGAAGLVVAARLRRYLIRIQRGLGGGISRDGRSCLMCARRTRQASTWEIIKSRVDQDQGQGQEQEQEQEQYHQEEEEEEVVVAEEVEGLHRQGMAGKLHSLAGLLLRAAAHGRATFRPRRCTIWTGSMHPMMLPAFHRARRRPLAVAMILHRYPPRACRHADPGAAKFRTPRHSHLICPPLSF